MESARTLHMLGVSFRSAPLAVRESLTFDSRQATALLSELSREVPELEAAVLSTCNRTEFYLVSDVPQVSKAVLFRRLKQSRPQASILRSDCYRYEHSGASAARHLLRVACGLESAVLGDTQILKQVREARNLAIDSRTLGKSLSQVFDRALAVGKRARAETTISQGNASIGSAISGMLAQRAHELTGGNTPRILILGAGDVAANIARHLSKRRFGSLYYVNRSWDRAWRLAQLYGGEARDWAELPAALAQADVIIAATSAPRPVLTRVMLDEVLRQRRDNPPFVVDAGMPRNVEDGVPVKVVDIDGIREQRNDVLRERHAAVPAVETLIQQHLDAWRRWQQSLPLEAIVKSLYLDLDDHQLQAVGELVGREGLHRDDVEHLVIRPLRRVLHRHVARLRAMHSFNFHEPGNIPCAL